MEFVTQRAVVAVRPRFHECEPGRRPADQHAVVGCEAGDHASVDHAGRALVGPRHEQFETAHCGIDDGSVGQRVGAQRRQDEGVEVLADDRAAGREVVGGRTDRSAHDQAVGAVRGGNLAVHKQTDLDHRERGTREDRRFVETEFAVDRHAVADHLGLEHEMFDESEPAAGDVFEHRLHFEDREIGEEAERAEVDAEYGHLLIAHPAGRPQDRAVATEREHQVGRRAIVRMKPSLAPVVLQGKPGGDAMARLLQR